MDDPDFNPATPMYGSNERRIQPPYQWSTELEEPVEAGKGRKVVVHGQIHALTGTTTKDSYSLLIDSQDRSQLIFSDQRGKAGQLF